MTPGRCPACASPTTFVGSLGCQALVRQCKDPWHCRSERHQQLAHASDPDSAMPNSHQELDLT